MPQRSGSSVVSSVFAVALAVAAVLAAGCASIQVVQETPRGGVVGLSGPSEGARAKAEEHMRAQCPFGYRIVDDRAESIAYACKDAGPRALPARRETLVGI